ncbi:acid-sensing ion channel 2-like [Anneissia japonica]|uniref:acid-sensing ion channel 2-like n=1 Tax=Anneissia japonica TaxID=1529436 RepID=UPI0014256EC6|nr:acid-sensing ion channel 2-like [Anneissia japonica]
MQLQQNFTHIFTSYGNCYTFNSGEGDTILEVKQPGAGNGLQMMIDIQQDEYTETMVGNIEAGLKILVHDQDEPPLIESKGISIPPGFHAFASSRRILVSNLDPPHGECDTFRTLTYYDVYTLSGCYIECRLSRILSECGCRPIRYPGNATECTPKQTTGCAKDVLSRMKNGSLEACDCPVPCAYTSFDTSVNYALIPSESVSGEMTTKYNVSESYIAENFVLLDVYYEDLNFQAYKQKPAMTFSALLSDVGGQLGLFIGASVLTFAELGQYLLQKFHAIFQSSNRRSRLRSSNVTPIRENHKIGIDNQSLELS